MLSPCKWQEAPVSHSIYRISKLTCRISDKLLPALYACNFFSNYSTISYLQQCTQCIFNFSHLGKLIMRERICKTFYHTGGKVRLKFVCLLSASKFKRNKVVIYNWAQTLECWVKKDSLLVAVNFVLNFIVHIWPMADRFWLNDYLSCWFFAVSCNYMWSKGILYRNGLAPYWNLSPCLWGTWIFIVQCYSWFVHIKQCKLHLWRWQRCTLPSGCKVSKFWPCDGMYQHVTPFQI